MGVVSFRLSEEEERGLRAMGINPAHRARELLHREVQHRRAGEVLALCRRHRTRVKKRAVVLVREMREGR